MLVICLVLAASPLAHAELRAALSLHGTLRTYDHSLGDDDHDGLGPGVSVQLLRAHLTYAHGLYAGWHTYREDRDGDAYTRFHVFQAHYFIEHKFDAGALGAGLGLDFVRQRHYSTDGAFSYSDGDTLLSLNVQLALDIVTLERGDKLGFVAGFGIFPLVDVLEVISGGEADVNWRGVTASAGLFWQY
jgi:hypothetical protein